LATLISHPIPAIALNLCVKEIPKRKSLFGFSVLLTIMPDFDVVAFRLGIPYEHILGHRGITHSILFALLVSILIAKFRLKYTGKDLKIGSGILFLSCISHGILDGFTNGGLGVGYFIPFTAERYFFPFTPIEVSPIGLRNFLSYRGLEVLFSEFKIIWIPSLIILLSSVMIKKIRMKNKMM